MVHTSPLAGITRFDRLASGANAIVDGPPEAQPALGLMLRLAEVNVPQHDLAALNDTLIGEFADVFDEAPQLAIHLVNMLPEALARRTQRETVEDVCRRLLSRRSLRDLARSLTREHVPSAESARYGSAWHRYFCEWREWITGAWQDFLLLGSKTPVHDPRFTLALPHEVEPTQVALLPRLKRSGKTGCALGLLYATSLAQYRPDSGQTPYYAPPSAFDGIPDLPSQSISPATSETALLDRLAQTFADASRYVADAAAPVSAQVDAALAAISSFTPLALPGVDGATTASPLIIKRTAIDASPATTEMRASPALQSLFDIAHLWRHRGAAHTELHKSFSPLLTFTAPPSERTLLDGLLANATEFSGIDRTELRLRRHAPAKNGGRLQRVTYWPLHDAAELIRSGQLNITAPDDGVSFDVSRMTLAGAVYEAPTVMTSTRFDDIVRRWRTACDDRSAKTWESPPELATKANSSLTQAIGTAFALDELSLGYTHALIGNRPFYLGQSALTNLSLSNDASGILFATHRLEFTIRQEEKDHVVAPAGSCVVTEPAGNGTTLLYLQGDAAAWRAFASPQALLRDIENNALGLRNTLCERLPRAFQTEALNGIRVTKLSRQTAQGPVAMAMQATLDTVKAEGSLHASHHDTGPRIAQYLTWLAGVKSETVEQGLQALREQSQSAGVSLPGQPVSITLRDVNSVAHVELLRYDISTAVPQVRQLVRRHLGRRLTTLGVTPANGDLIYVRAAGRNVQSLTEAVMLGTVPSEDTKQLTLLLPEVGSQYTSVYSVKKPAQQPLTVNDVLDEGSMNELRQHIDRADAKFWETSRGKVRKVLKSEFIAQVWMSRSRQRMSVDQVHIATRIAGPIEIGRLGSDDLDNEIKTPEVEREWLWVSQWKSRLMRVSIPGRSPCLLIAPYPGGMRIYSFDDRDRMSRWFTEQVRSDATRERIVSLFDGAPGNATWYNAPSIDMRGVRDTTSVDTFTAIASAYETQHNHPAPSTVKSEYRPVLNLMDKFSKVDLAFGLGSWALPFARPLSLAYSVVDAGVGAIGMGVGLATHDSALFKQGWENSLSAIGAQGIAASRFKVMLFLRGDARYKYFVSQAPRAEDALILGLHRVDGRFYAAIDSDTRAYLSLDSKTGFFRMAPESASEAIKEDAPLLRRSQSGRWHVVTQADFAAPELEDPDTAWRIDQGFRARFDELRDLRDPVFESARRAVTNADTAGNAIPLQWQLRLLKLDFIDLSVTDAETLGKLAGRIDYLQDVLDAAETFVISPLSDEATRLGALYKPVTQRARVYLGHVRNGLLRACPLLSENFPVETAVTVFNRAAALPPSATERLMQDLSELGRIELKYLPQRSLSLGIETLDTLFNGAQDTERAFEISAGTRTLLMGRHIRTGAAAQYYFLDPALALVSHSDSRTIIDVVRTHLNAMAGPYELVREGGAYAIGTKEIDLTFLANVHLFRDFNDVVPVRVALRL
ncbi:dermonecrotic toxin domain-containing protein [Pandoraea capi]|nr:DUF6543 domain-containing protein [Pandoraea capi]